MLGFFFSNRLPVDVAKDKTFRVFTEEEGGAQHCQRDYLTRAVDVIADWLDEKLK